MNKINTLEDLIANNNLSFKNVFLRLDLNVPMNNGVIKDDTRIVKSIPTIKLLLDQKCHLTIASHLGRPKGKSDNKYSLIAVGERLSELLELETLFCDDYIQEPSHQIADRMQVNQLLLLENLRFHPEEKSNNMAFSEQLIKGYDFYVNDAFGSAHRAHASITGIPNILKHNQCAAGLLIEKELKALDRVLNNPAPPFTAVLGGAKVSDKIPTIINLLSISNNILIGGAMAYSFLSYNGYKTGSSLVERAQFQNIAKIYELAKSRKVEIILPEDHIVAAQFASDSPAHVTTGVDISAGFMGLDIGPKSIAKYTDVIHKSKTIVWNGPMGVFEWEQFKNGTFAVSKSVANATAFSLVGGGDSLNALNDAGMIDKVSHASTGGGALLEYLEGKDLPGIVALTN